MTQTAAPTTPDIKRKYAERHTIGHIHRHRLAHVPHDDCGGTAPEYPSEPVWRPEGLVAL